MAADRARPLTNSPRGTVGPRLPGHTQGFGGLLPAARERRLQITDWTLTEER